MVRKNYEATAAKGRLTARDVETRLGLIRGTTEFEAVAEADLIVEAVFEEMKLKQEVFATLDRVARADAVLATNTSSLDVNEIAAATDWVVAQQLKSGIDIGNDGEEARVGFQTYIPQRMDGFGGVSKRPFGKEFVEFSQFTERMLARITDRLVNACLIQEELQKNPLTISSHDLQMAMDAFRKARNLYKAEDTYRWMESRGLSHQALERLVESEAVVVRLRDNLVGNDVDAYFAAHCSDFDTVRVARFFVPDEATARSLCERIRSGEAAFFEEAQRQFLASGHLRPPADAFALFATVQRREAAAAFREILFGSSLGSVLEPVRESNGYAIICVLSMSRAVLDTVTAEIIRNILFETWLEKRRQAATIEWLWGNVSTTGKQSETRL